MAHKQKWQLTVSGEWARHLRKYLKRRFWKAERNAGRRHTYKSFQEYNEPPTGGL